MDADEFRRLGHELIDFIAGYREGIEGRPVKSRVSPGEIRARFTEGPPEKGGEAGRIAELLEQRVMPGITHWNHPRFFAYFPSNTSYASILGDLVSSGLGVQGMSWETSPAATEVEEVMMDWLRAMVGLSPAWTGVIHDTASTATLCALLCARERTTSMCQERGGLAAEEARLVVYASDQGHSSIAKAALLAGFGRENLRLLPTDDRHALRVDALREAVARDVAAGLRPCAVVAASGTTGTTAFDPVAAIAEVVSEYGMWLHVDAAMAGTAMVLPEMRSLWEGVERADSVVWNPHKWMGVGFDFSAYHCKDPQHLVRVMGTNPTYLRTAHDGQVTNYRDWHIPLGRRFRALKLWFYLLDVGVSGIQARLRRDIANARWLGGEVEGTAGFELLAPVALQTVCLRHVPAGMDEAALAAHNLLIARLVNDSGFAYLTPSVLKGRQMLRVSIGAERTERRHVEELWSALKAAAGEALTGW